MRRSILRLFPLLVLCLFACEAGAQEPVRVFLLAGQSNMYGFGRSDIGRNGAYGAVGSLRYEVVNDPANYGHLVDGAGQWVVRDDVWVWAGQGGTYNPLPQQDTITTGNLTAGVFGYPNGRFGPELGIGHVLGDMYDEPVVLIKTAWNSASLFGDFRPPSSGNPADPTDTAYPGGAYYQRMLSYYSDAIQSTQNQFPGRELVLTGMFWNQGLSDQLTPGQTDHYEQNLANLITDIRDALGAPGLPVVIAETGNGGLTNTDPAALSLIAAQQAVADPTLHPEFAGSVAFAQTRAFWREQNISPSNEFIHWYHNGESYYLIGDAMGDAMAGLLVPEPASAVVWVVLGGLIARRRRG